MSTEERLSKHKTDLPAYNCLPGRYNEAGFPAEDESAGYLAGRVNQPETAVLFRAKLGSPFAVQFKFEEGPQVQMRYVTETNEWLEVPIPVTNQGFWRVVLSEADLVASHNQEMIARLQRLHRTGEQFPELAGANRSQIERAPDEREFFEPPYFHPADEIIEKTVIPKDWSRLPAFKGMSGGARGGTTASGILFANHPDVYCDFFQGHKNGLRHGVPLVIPPTPSQSRGGKKWALVLKDTTGPLFDEELFDPLGMLIETFRKAGVPGEELDIAWAFTVRDPFESFQSLTHFTDRMDPHFYAQMQAHTIGLFHHYNTPEWREKGVKVVPFVYDLFEYGELVVMHRLMERLGFAHYPEMSLKFDFEAIHKKMAWGEAEDIRYWWQVIVPTLCWGEFTYVSGTVAAPDLNPQIRQILKEQCMPSYQAFYELARVELGL